MKRAKILLSTSRNAFKSLGGGEVLLLKSKQYLEKLGFAAEVFDGSQGFADFEILHNFNVHRDCFSQVSEAKEAGLKIVVSPVYWPGMPNALIWKKGFAEKGKLLAVETLNRVGLGAVRKMLSIADAVTPSSRAEAAILQRMFGIEEERVHIVHNGVDKMFLGAKSKAFEREYGFRNFVLYAGRIEERKNVLSLVRAVKGIDETLVIIGNAKLGSEGYFQKCREEAGSNVVFLPRLEHGSNMLSSAYAACKVFALPTWYETPGLAALEAALAGANIVVTTEGCTKEYFQRFASYAKPRSVKDIREKILYQLHQPRSPALKMHVQKNFLWENSAIETAAAYEKVLVGRK